MRLTNLLIVLSKRFSLVFVDCVMTTHDRLGNPTPKILLAVGLVATIIPVTILMMARWCMWIGAGAGACAFVVIRHCQRRRGSTNEEKKRPAEAKHTHKLFKLLHRFPGARD